MKSKFGDKFNHDDEADQYDDHVQREEIPYREGYNNLLTWVADKANSINPKRVLDLGIGTGNLSERIQAAEIVGVDNSEKMLSIAKTKLQNHPCELIQTDILSFFDTQPDPFDAIVSTYALHHLTPDEKTVLIESCVKILNLNGIIIFGDLMFESVSEQARINAQFREGGLDDMVDEAEEEFYWILDQDLQGFHTAKINVAQKRFSKLSWSILASRNPLSTES